MWRHRGVCVQAPRLCGEETKPQTGAGRRRSRASGREVHALLTPTELQGRQLPGPMRSPGRGASRCCWGWSCSCPLAQALPSFHPAETRLCGSSYPLASRRCSALALARQGAWVNSGAMSPVASHRQGILAALTAPWMPLQPPGRAVGAPAGTWSRALLIP